MRRGRIMGGMIALVAVAAFFTGASAALADNGSPMDICQDLQDGKLDAGYTSAQLQAFYSDPTVQGYCGPITIVVTPPAPCVDTSMGGTVPPGSVACQPTTQPQSPPAATVSPTVITAVKGATHTVAAPARTPAATVKGAQHTVRAPVTASAAAPLATTRSSGTLPFTGAQLALFALVGAALIATGLVLRSTARSSDRS